MTDHKEMLDTVHEVADLTKDMTDDEFKRCMSYARDYRLSAQEEDRGMLR